MSKRTKYYLLSSLAIIAIVFFAASVFASEIECKRDARGIMVPEYTVTLWGKFARLSKPTTAKINETPSIKEMLSQPAPKLSHKTDVIGNTVSTQTDNSGKTLLGQ